MKINWKLIGLKISRILLIYGTLGLIPLFNLIKIKLDKLLKEIDKEIAKEDEKK